MLGWMDVNAVQSITKRSLKQKSCYLCIGKENHCSHGLCREKYVCTICGVIHFSGFQNFHRTKIVHSKTIDSVYKSYLKHCSLWLRREDCTRQI